jgi:hypothetical protein
LAILVLHVENVLFALCALRHEEPRLYLNFVTPLLIHFLLRCLQSMPGPGGR